MNILIVLSVDIKQASTFTLNQIRYLHPVKVLSDGYQPYKCDQQSIFSFPFHINLFRVLAKRLMPFFYTKLYNQALCRFLATHKIDVVLCNYGPQGSYVVDACEKSGIPLVVHFHGYDAFVHRILQRFKTKYLNLFQKATCLIAVSENMRHQLVSLGAPREKVVLRPCGIDTSLFGAIDPQQNDKVLIFVGRFTAKKAPDLLLAAFHLALQHVPDARLVMIGAGELQTMVEGTIRLLNIQKEVTLMGWQSSETIAKEMQKARAYVQYSVVAENGDSEGSPVAIMEAAGCGLPIISTRHAGINELVVENVTGFLVDEDNWQDMGKHMIQLLNDPELAAKMGSEGRAHILKNYDISQQMKELQTILEKAQNPNAYAR